MHVFTLKESPISYYKSLLPQLINSVLTFIIVEFVVDSTHGIGVIASLLYKSVLICLCTILLATLFKQYSIKDVAKMAHVLHKR